jgi:hypothetical protein
MKRSLTSVISVIVLAGLLGLGTGSRAEAACSAASVKGSYAFSCTGTVGLPSSPVPQAIVGILTLDGEGGLSVKATLMQDGGPAVPITPTGTYTVNADCTGSTVIGGSFHYDIAIFDHRGGFFSIETDPGTQVTCVKHKE